MQAQKQRQAIRYCVRLGAVIATGLIIAVLGCRGKTGRTGPAGTAGASATNPPASTSPTPRELERGTPAPGVNFTITSISGGAGPNGQLNPGNFITVEYTLLKDDGSAWDVKEMDRARILVSGPTFNYQRVLEEQTDVADRSVEIANGRYSYTFAAPIPATYLPPLNDTGSLGEDDGEMSGQAILDGTYTVGLYGRWEYEVEGESHRDVGNTTADFLMGNATTLAKREVVTQANCEQCHDTLQAHGGFRRDVTLCLMCHTSGAEDGNAASVAGGTPGTTIDFRVMIHKIHNGAHLPSVLGVTTFSGGSRDYSATPEPYVIMGYRNRLNDFSEVEFPVWPVAAHPMPRDDGYDGLSSAEKSVEDTIRSGVVDCDKCHGDPDGAGGMSAPTQGELAYAQPTRKACGSCHDDVRWDYQYTGGLGTTMPHQNHDAACVLCHAIDGDYLSVTDAHRHPTHDPAVNPGLVFNPTAVTEGAGNGDGDLDANETPMVTFTIEDNEGNAVDPAAISSVSVVVGGPTTNLNILLNGSIPTAALTGSQPYTTTLPEARRYEFVGRSTLTAGEAFETSRMPLWDDRGAPTTVMLRSGNGDGSTTLSMDAFAPQNYIDVVDSTGFDRNVILAIDEGQPTEEYLRVQWVDGNRIWFSSMNAGSYKPGLDFAHGAGATVVEAVLTTADPATYTINTAMARITEVSDFGDDVAVVVSYTTDFIMPETYPLALNDTPDVTETAGKWTGKSLVPGTYTVTMWSYRNLAVTQGDATTTYRGTSEGASVNFLYGDAMSLTPYAAIDSKDACASCHNELWFHGGGRRGFDACIACHGTAGAEDRPQYVAPGAPATTGVAITFRSMLHKIHHGSELAQGSGYQVVGYGSAGAYPDNYTAHSYEHVEFPAMAAGAKQCESCHGNGSSSWFAPTERQHPTEQGAPTREWTQVCGSCHDSSSAAAHIDIQTSVLGAESCGVCHGDGREWSVELMHEVRK